MKSYHETHYSSGQVWSVKSIDGRELQYKLLILRSETINLEKIVHVQPFGGLLNMPQHLPFSESAIDRSVCRLLKEHHPIPDFSEGYRYWRECYDQGNAGVYDITVSEVLDI